jgi:hypothetical protein
MKTFMGVYVQICVLFTSTLVGSEWSTASLYSFTSEGKSPGIRWIRGWVDPRTGLDGMEK